MRLIYNLLIVVLSTVHTTFPCTTAIVSGKATLDGRPLLLKNRDADALQNRLVYFFDGKYKFIGLVNSKDASNSEVWCGYNSAGFAIMNSASYNLKQNDTTKLSDREGIIMKLALERCATLQDFEELLDELDKPLGVEANFGVIDASGGAAYYETDNFKYTKFDANDPAVAPFGYLIRTNYSVSGIANKGAGYIRFKTASDLFAKQYETGKISFEFLINDVPRCLIHSFTGENLTSGIPSSAQDTDYVFFRDYIPRYYSSAAVVVQGVKNGEKPDLVTMWSIIGFPLTSVIIPVWLIEDGVIPLILQADENGNAPLCDLALKLKDKVFPVQTDAKENYLNLAALINKENTGVRQKIIPVEDEILTKAKEMMHRWRITGINNSEVKEFYKWIDSSVISEIKSRFEAAD